MTEFTLKSCNIGTPIKQEIKVDLTKYKLVSIVINDKELVLEVEAIKHD